MRKEFVTYKIAKKLKELNFSEPCCAFANPTIKNDFIPGRINDPIKDNNWFIMVPLWQQVLDWLRDKHACWVDITPMGDLDNFRVSVSCKHRQNVSNNVFYKSYTKAREAGVLMALRIVEDIKNYSKPELLFNYQCTKCGSKYLDLKEPLPYENCKVEIKRNPNPEYCNGKIKILNLKIK